MIHYFNWY